MATSGRPKREELPPEIVQRIYECSFFDCLLYEQCKRRLQERFNECDFGGAFIEYKHCAEALDRWNSEAFWDIPN